MGGTD